ncbi:erythromycin esterase family protein [Celeribacter indicus]|uniref:Protein-L-isoaspartate O-methyltransferase n=1 Tax=Celeribacter indicus TaxID=1208324 RepID=A0A0B5E421_9RHOB|nr:erythromycin esterase family protein [Celeribacter indicus]AJE47117.1 protein-L-isoaspartate O-methyltransferase [Celeribacter indicus]SDW90415.1 Erythromycin esterase homolog [Celeribacter indicus]
MDDSTGRTVASERELIRDLREAAEPLPQVDDPAFARMFDRWADARVLLLGEASHGTAEFYRARAAITRHMIEHHGLRIVAVEADWPDAAAIDAHIRHRHTPSGEAPFQRFPTWMWRNTEIAALVGWMRDWNAGRAPEDRVAFRGLDLYSLTASIRAVLAYLEEVDPEAAAIARDRYGCLAPWADRPAAYGRAALHGHSTCEEAVVEQCRALLDRDRPDGDALLDATQNARLVAAAERYYRTMYRGGAAAWNLRDTHMFNTLCQLLEAGGPEAKAIVWAHNSHIGDARATDMGWRRDEVNIGQLCRERFGSGAQLIGFGTHGGTVAAASDWDAPMEVKRITPSRADSYERLCHETGHPRFLLETGSDAGLAEKLSEPRLERFIGVIYRPATEFQSHYAEAVLPEQFDGWVWFDETRALTPLGPEARHGPDDTWPFGL